MNKFPLALCFVFFAFSSAAYATDEAYVSLTQEQVQRLIRAETARAVANFAAAQESEKAKDVYDAMQKAFAPMSPKPDVPKREPLSH